MELREALRDLTVQNPAAVPAMNWSLVIADDHYAVDARVPLPFCRSGNELTPFQRTMRRAARFARASRVMITAPAGERHHWERAGWFVRPERRFVSEEGGDARLSAATAVLALAANFPTHTLTVLPAHCQVAHEEILQCAVRRALASLAEIPEGIITLGMLDIEEGVDEDYLVVRRARAGLGLECTGYARRPVPWVARHLREHGALVASGIMVGYASVFASHILHHWPGLARELEHRAAAAAAVGRECGISTSLSRGVSQAALRALRWHPPACRQRVFGVCRSGWSGLKSPLSVARARRAEPLESAIASGIRPSATGISGVRVARWPARGLEVDHDIFVGP
jgi:hypothetical protein